MSRYWSLGQSICSLRYKKPFKKSRARVVSNEDMGIEKQLK